MIKQKNGINKSLTILFNFKFYSEMINLGFSKTLSFSQLT